MNHNLSRRDLLGAFGASAVAASLGGLASQGHADTETIVKANRKPATVVGGKVIQPRRELAVLRSTDVLVVGGGPAGVAAAVAARRTGADVTLVERYGCFGGLWTCGLVLTLPGICVGVKQTTQGIGEEILRRLDAMDRAIIDRGPGQWPTVDPESAKYVLSEMIREAGVHAYLHCWGVDAITDGNTVQGAVFESKSGRQAILAKVVVDTTGDGDIFVAAGAKHRHEQFKIGLVCRIGNVDKVDKSKAKLAKPPSLGDPTPVPGINWINMSGPIMDAVDIVDLTKLEMNHRRQIWRRLEKIRKTPGYEQVYLVDVASQLGVRISRILAGRERLTYDAMLARKTYPDVIGIGGGLSEEHPEWQIPYGALVPQNTDNLLTAGRSVSAEQRMWDLMREIPTCFVTGHAAGTAAALSVQYRCRPGDVDTRELQKVLKQQDAYLG